jgi:hypothetical protein
LAGEHKFCPKCDEELLAQKYAALKTLDQQKECITAVA